MDDTRDRALARIAEAQHGLFTAAQASELGFAEDQREFRTRIGRWAVVHPGVYLIAGVPRSWKAEVLASCWAARSLAVASHRSAAALWELPGGRTSPVELTCRRSRRARPPGLIVHETKLLRPDDLHTVDGVPTTSIEQTLLGLAAVVHESTVEMAIDRALYRQLTTVISLRKFVDQKGKQGRNGIGVLRGFVRGLDPQAGVPESPMETKLKQLLRRHGLPTPVLQYEIWHLGRFVARVDAAYPEHRIALEYDSYEHHAGNLAIDRDSERRARLSGIGWETITFTAAAIRNNGGRALETLRRRLGFGGTPPR